MTKSIRFLSVLLAAQIALTIWLAFTGNSLSAAESNKPLLALKADAVDHLTIDGPNDSHVVLAKVNGHWQLPDVNNFPADSGRVKRLLDQLDQLKPGAPVATTSGARERFKVAEKTFERRIVFGAGNKVLGTLYLGTSPAMRQVHARIDAQDAIYAVNFETYEVPVKADAWEDHAVLQVPQPDIAGIDVDGLQLRRAAVEQNVTKTLAAAATAPADKTAPVATHAQSNPAKVLTQSAAKPTAPTTWHVELAPGEHVDTAAVDKLAAQLANLRIEGVLGKTAKPEYGLDKPELQMTVVRKDGKSVQYQLGKMTGGDYALKSSARAEYFTLPNYAAQQLLDDAKRQALVPATNVASAEVANVEKNSSHKKH